MLHKNAVSKELLNTAIALTKLSELSTFRMVDGTAIALQLVHRRSIDIDLFTNEKINKREAVSSLEKVFPESEFYLTQHFIRSVINGIRVELFDDWHTPFLCPPVNQDGLRLAALNDLAAFKLDAIVERREKKDYIDLYFLFRQLGAENILEEFKTYNPYISMKSILFALGEVYVARENKSVMPEMIIDISWREIEQAMTEAAKSYILREKKG